MVRQRWFLPGIVAAGTSFLVLFGVMGRRVSAEPASGARERAGAISAARLEFEQHVDSLIARLDQLATSSTGTGRAAAVEAFRAARTAYKRVEGVLAFVGPFQAAALNGPPLEDDELQPAGPLGVPAAFQIVEQALFGGEQLDADSLRATVDGMREVMRSYRTTAYRGIRPVDVLNAARLEIARVSALGLAGFDSDLSGDAVRESADALDGLRLVLSAAMGDSIRAPVAWRTAIARLDEAAAYLRAHPAVDSLDRIEFYARYAAPAARAVAAARAALPMAIGRRLWRSTAATIFDDRAFDPSAFAPHYASSSPVLVELGRRLFHDARLSGSGHRSCALCHDPARAFSDGRPTSPLLTTPTAPPRNTPTLVNAALQPKLFADLRAPSLEEQVRIVLASPSEMGGSADLAAERIAHDSTYRALFAAAAEKPADGEITGWRIRTALAAFVRSLTALDSRFDRAVRGDSTALTALERQGFTVFMGKGRCGTCHFLPLFNGTAPPDFASSEPEIIGTTTHPVTRGAKLDPDRGLGAFDREVSHGFAFRTPTLRNVALTAPYMHNGAFKTLEQVVDFYNRGGGAGLGLDVPGQTLPARKLDLTRSERRALIAFLGTLTDTTIAR